MRSRFGGIYVVRMASMLACGAVCIGRAETAPLPHEVRQRIEHAIEQLRQLDALEIEAVDELHVELAKLGLPAFGRRTWFKYVKFGSRYRVECTNEMVGPLRTKAGNTNLVQKVVVTYDGTKWYQYVDDYRYLVVGRKNPPGDPSPCPLNPAIAHFVFLSKETDECPACRVLWDDVVTGSSWTNLSYQGCTRSNEVLEVTYAGLKLEGKTQYWSIVLDAEANGYEPRLIKRVIPDSAIMEYRFESYTNIAFQVVDGQSTGSLTIPLAFSYSAADLANGKLVPVLRGSTKLLSVRFPKELPATLFQVDESDAMYVLDRDQNELVKTAGAYALVLREKSWKRPAILVTIVLVSVGMFWLLFRTLARGKRNPSG